MYTSVDLSALRGKKPFTGRSGGQAHLPDRWTILLGVSYLLGILLGTKAMELAPENLQSGMLTIFSEHLAARTSQTLQQAVLSAFWQAAVTYLAVSAGILRSGTAIVPGGTAV